MASPHAVLLDMDGCIVDSLPTITRCWGETLTHFGYLAPTEEQVRPLLGPPAVWVTEQLAPQADAAQRVEILADYRRRSTLELEIPAYPGMTDVIVQLADSGIVLALATSKSLAVAAPLLGRLGVRDRFTVVEGTHDNEPGAKKALVIERVLAQLGDIQVLAHVGDRREDVVGAHEHGLHVIGVLWGYGDRQELADADELADSPVQLSTLLRGLAG